MVTHTSWAGKSGRTDVPKLTILMYHNVGLLEYPVNCMHNDCHIDRFKSQMAYLRRFGYSVISLSQAVEGIFGNASLPNKPVVLSFDDGYRDFHEHVFPVLRDYGYPAIVYMVSGLVGRTAIWLNEFGLNPPLMGVKELREIHQGGIEIGAHAVNHVHLDQLSLPDITYEIFDSKARLEDILGAPIRHFCYPHGDYDDRARSAVIQAGFRSATSTHRGAANYSENPYEILRKSITYRHTLLSLFIKLNLQHHRRPRRVKQQHLTA